MMNDPGREWWRKATTPKGVSERQLLLVVGTIAIVLALWKGCFGG